MLKSFANIAFLMLITIIPAKIYSQDSISSAYKLRWKTYKKTEILAGFSWQNNFKDEDKMARYIEVGFANSIHLDGRHGPSSLGVYAAEEIYFGHNTTTYGTKVGAYTHYIFDLGLAVIYYTDFKKGNFKIRPEIGIGMGAVRIIVGYNAPTINNKAFELLRRNNGQVSMQFFIPVKKKEIDRNKGTTFKQLFKKQ